MFFTKINGYLAKRSAEHKKQNSQDRAARITALATVYIALFTLVTVGVSVLAYFVLAGQLNEMKVAREGSDKSSAEQMSVMQAQTKAMQAQVEISRQALLASDRPWLQVAGFKVKRLQIDERYVFIGADLKLRNVGHSPALDIHIIPVLMPSLSTTEEASKIIQICNEAKARTFNFYNSVVFPGEDRTYVSNETSSHLDIASIQRGKEVRVRDNLIQQRDIMGDGPAEAEAQRVMNLPLRDGLTLLGCVTYKFVIGGEVHATSFGLDFSRNCPESPVGMCAFEFSQPAIILHDGLTERPVLGASYAD